MGMEGKLRQVSEFEIARYRKNPDEFYSSFMKMRDPGEAAKLMKAMQDLQQSPSVQAVQKRVRQRAMAGLPPHADDVKQMKEMQQQMQAVMASHGWTSTKMEDHIGLSRDGQQLALHKSWHCLHFVLTGKSWEKAEPPLGDAIMGGVEIPDRQKHMGYGPARYLTATQVRDVAGALASFPMEEKAAAFDPGLAEEHKVYVPNHESEELIYYFHLLRDFYQDAAVKGNGMILWVE